MLVRDAEEGFQRIDQVIDDWLQERGFHDTDPFDLDGHHAVAERRGNGALGPSIELVSHVRSDFFDGRGFHTASALAFCV